ncbi:MAG: hypothetical protein IH983_09045 [Planctomycetes bacterium]|nr:hypothetical protein [Planctomycetota bacterium]
MRVIASPRPPTEPNVMALLALNAVLLGLLAVVTFGPTVAAQDRGRGDYTMVAGRANGADSSVVYIVDTANQELIAVTYSQSNKRVDGIGYRNLAGDSAGLMRGRTRPGS